MLVPSVPTTKSSREAAAVDTIAPTKQKTISSVAVDHWLRFASVSRDGSVSRDAVQSISEMLEEIRLLAVERF
jgi:hypothetical protein